MVSWLLNFTKRGPWGSQLFKTMNYYNIQRPKPLRRTASTLKKRKS